VVGCGKADRGEHHGPFWRPGELLRVSRRPGLPVRPADADADRPRRARRHRRGSPRPRPEPRVAVFTPHVPSVVALRVEEKGGRASLLMSVFWPGVTVADAGC